MNALRPVVSAQLWKDLGMVVLSFASSMVAWVVFFAGPFTGVVLTATVFGAVLGIPWLVGSLWVSRQWANLERRRARLPQVRWRWVGTTLQERAQTACKPSWRDVLWMAVMLPLGIATSTIGISVFGVALGYLTAPIWAWALPDGLEFGIWQADALWELFLVALVIGPIAAIAAAWVLRGLVTGERRLAEAVLGPSARERIEHLTESRAGAVDAAAAELRRIERDLHDGAQARLVALAMDLGMAKERMSTDPEAAATLVDEAHEEAKTALQELRDLARGIHPAILTDRGLDAAVSALAARCTVPCSVEVRLRRRLSPAVESAAYFVVSEALTNVSKHSGARKARVVVHDDGPRLLVEVRDDGTGGADAGRGTGLAGLRGRVAAVDGTFTVDSPEGFGTVLRAELPA